jgi:hypothetical protein
MFRSQFTLSRCVMIISIAGLMANSERAFAEDTESARYMVPHCRDDSPDAFMNGFCSGLVDAIFYFGKGICAPPQVTHSQKQGAVLQYIDSHPARLNENFKNLALQGMQYAWPCKR